MGYTLYLDYNVLGNVPMIFTFTCFFYIFFKLINFLISLNTDTHTQLFTPQCKKEQWCLFPTRYYRCTHAVTSLVCVGVCRHAGDNVLVCVLLILSIVSSLIISSPPRHGHQLLRGAIIWNWFSPPTSHGPGSEYKILLWQERRMKAND